MPRQLRFATARKPRHRTGLFPTDRKNERKSRRIQKHRVKTGRPPVDRSRPPVSRLHPPRPSAMDCQ